MLHSERTNNMVIRFKGLFGTTINGHATIDQVVSNVGDLVIDPRDGGEDSVFIRGLVAHQGDASLPVLGDGDDVFQMDDSAFHDIEIEGISTLVANDSRAQTEFTVSPTVYVDVFDLDRNRHPDLRAAPTELLQPAMNETSFACFCGPPF